MMRTLFSVLILVSTSSAFAAELEVVSQQGGQPTAVLCEKARQIGMNNIALRCSPPDRPFNVPPQTPSVLNEDSTVSNVAPDLFKCDYNLHYECTKQ